MRPVILPPNPVPRFYRGGAAIAALRGVAPGGDRVPEEWVGSMTTVFGDAPLGLSRLPDGGLLREAAAADPISFFGPEHAAERGGDPALLVKLLDAGERLPVHVHPDDPFAREVLGAPYGKSEAWIVIGTAGPSATVSVGFRDYIPPDTLAGWVREQDTRAMIDALNPLEVTVGDAVFVPAGVPHAIGEGLLILELQEPSDLSVLLEWRGFADGGESEASLGLGWEVALGCVELAARDPAALGGHAPEDGSGVTSLLPAEADRFFRAERIEASPVAELDPGFSIVVALEGAAELRSEDGEPLRIERGDTVLLPWSAGACRVEGGLVGLRCRPPGGPG